MKGRAEAGKGAEKDVELHKNQLKKKKTKKKKLLLKGSGWIQSAHKVLIPIILRIFYASSAKQHEFKRETPTQSMTMVLQRA